MLVRREVLLAKREREWRRGCAQPIYSLDEFKEARDHLVMPGKGKGDALGCSSHTRAHIITITKQVKAKKTSFFCILSCCVRKVYV